MSADDIQQNPSSLNPLELTFTPDWIKKPPVSIRGRVRSETTSSPGGSSSAPVEEKEEVAERSDDRRRFRPSRPRGGERREERDGGRDGKSDRMTRRHGEERVEVPFEGAMAAATREDRSAEGGARGDRIRFSRSPEPLPDLAVSFLPERSGLHLVARRIASAACAFPLFQIAAFFLNQPDHLSVRLSPTPPASNSENENGSEEERTDSDQSENNPPVRQAQSPLPPPVLFQCQICKQVYQDRGRVSAHVFQQHFDRWYRKEEQEVEPPSGHFSSVARCPFSGELLGPPNHHAFEERLLYLHRTRFSHLSLEEYRRRLENVRDPALIEEWRKMASRKTRYFVVAASEEQSPLESIEKVERHFQEHYLADSIRGGTALTIPGPVAHALDDPALRRLVQEAWRRAMRFPLPLSITLRLMFRHMGLHIFKTEDGTHYVTAIMPSPLDPEGTAPAVREILEFLAAHPRATRSDLLGALRAGKEPDSPGVRELTAQLHWLREKGHVIEFTGGAFILPGSAIRRVQPAHPEERRENRRPKAAGERRRREG